MNPSDRSICYQIRLQGHLDERWLRWFEDLTITREPCGEMLLTGEMDQAGLFGILDRIRDLGVELISVQRYSDDKN